MEWIDTHTHLADQVYQDNLDEVLQRAKEARVNHCIAVGTDLTDSARGIDLCRIHPDMTCTVGVHPHEAAKRDSDYLDHLDHLARDESVCAIGEIGLDYHYDFSKPDIQQMVFAEQLELADKLQLPVVIHSRESLEDCLAVLDENNMANHPVVFHCFTGTTTDVRNILDRGFWISFTGTITFGNVHETRKVIHYVPMDRVMLETDCPWLSPAPKRSVKPNEPALLVHTAEKFAQLRSKSLEEIAQVTTYN
ncbi:MAG: TatD family hydrolase, partial [Planctomycetes bacterium]|nr:TatD family hydrolase [Planctomycetota bacterium]